ncbi:MAG: cation diffusion facilitator family transporter [Bacteroidales bacterium]
MKEESIKFKVQQSIVIGSVLLMAGKFIAFFITNSVGILTDATESIVNVTAGFISLYSIYVSNKPRDYTHPFGHGKIELISASIEALMILAAGGIIIYEGIRRLFEPQLIDKLDVGILIIAAAGIINWIMGSYCIKVGKKYDSIALIASGRHLHSDVYSTIGLVVGLIILYITKIPWIDSALAILFGAIIMYTGIDILRNTTANLMDKVDEDVLSTIYKCIVSNRAEDWIDIHNMKVLKYGSYYSLECDLTLPWYYTIREGHEASVRLARIIKSEYPDKIRVSIHNDSCFPKKDCKGCLLSFCPKREFPFEKSTPLTFENMVENADSLC